VNVKYVSGLIVTILLSLFPNNDLIAQIDKRINLKLTSSPVCHIADREIVSWYQKSTGLKRVTVLFESMLQKDLGNEVTPVQYADFNSEKFFNLSNLMALSPVVSKSVGIDFLQLGICSSDYQIEKCFKSDTAEMIKFSKQKFSSFNQLDSPIPLKGKSHFFFLAYLLVDSDNTTILNNENAEMIKNKLRITYGSKLGKSYLADSIVRNALDKQSALGSLPTTLIDNNLIVDMPHLDLISCKGQVKGSTKS
jgi:hypothetical protein